MTENLKKFLEEVGKNEELKAKLAALTDKETAVAKAIEIAKEHGFTLTAADFEQKPGEEISPEEMSAVTGGTLDCFVASQEDKGKCFCVIVGAV